MEGKKYCDARQLAIETGRSRQVIYLLCKRLGRLPTKEEVLSRKVGRPLKYRVETK